MSLTHWLVANSILGQFISRNGSPYDGAVTVLQQDIYGNNNTTPKRKFRCPPVSELDKRKGPMNQVQLLCGH